MNHHETPPVSAFHIEKMPHGGFVVTEAPMLLALMTGQGSGRFYGTVYAATDIADALGFIGDKLAPVKRSPGETTPDPFRDRVTTVGADVAAGSASWLAPDTDPA